MTKKDYVMLAAQIRAALTAPLNPVTDSAPSFVKGVSFTAQAIAQGLARDNVRFDRERFLAACGLAEVTK